MSFYTQFNPRLNTKSRLITFLAWALSISLFSAGCAAAPVGQTALQTDSQTSTSAAPIGKSQLVSADEALKILKENANATLLDVRTPAEFAEGYIEGAINFAAEEFADRQKELPADKSAPVIVYCRSGRRSAIAAATLINLGYTAVYDLGGIQDWPYEIVK